MTSWLALGLVLGGAFVHAFWNLLVKQSENKAAFMYFSVIASVTLFGPIAIFSTPLQIVPALLPVLVISGTAEVGYVIALTRAYEHGDLSVVYPLARGSAPFFVTLWSGFIMGERLPPLGYLGVGLIICGIYLTTLPSLRDWLKPIRSLEQVSSRLALLSGLFIAAYTLADREGVRLISPVTYNFYVFTLMALGLTPYLWFSRYRHTARAEWRANWLSISGTGTVSILNYLVVLWALTIMPASYVSAVRSTSIVIGAFYGWRLRHERLGSARLVAVSLITLGIISLAVGG
ncbi:MAG: EamA family transporter [Chloroflexi bacterium]|nr:EamA family transporter [Chloroflexota bacterium]